MFGAFLFYFNCIIAYLNDHRWASTTAKTVLFRMMKMYIENRCIVLCVFVGIFLRKNLNWSIIKKCFMTSLVEIDPVVLEKVFKCLPCIFFYFAIKRLVLLLNLLNFPLTKDNLWLVWLKLAQWLWRTRWKNEKTTYIQTDHGQQAISKAYELSALVR